MNTYRRLISYVRPHIKILGVAFVCMFATSLFNAFPITMMIPLVDRIMADKLIVVPDHGQIPGFVMRLIEGANAMPRLSILNILVVAALLLTIFRSIFEYCYTYFMSDVSHRVTRDLRDTIYQKVIRMPLKFFAHARAGALVSRITYDTGVVRDAISEGVKDLLFQPIELLVNIAILFSVRWIFGIPWHFILIIALILPMIVYPVIRLGKVLKKISRQTQEQMAEINASLYESISGIRVVQAFGMEDYENKRFHGHNWNYYSTMMRSISRTIMISPITDIVMALCGCIVIWIGGRHVINYGMSPGAFLAFLTALFSLFRPFKRLSRLHSINQTALAAAERIFEILDAEEDVKNAPNAPPLAPIRESIEYRNVSFRYEESKSVLENVNLSIRAGEIVAVVGPSGAGKTTLVNLLPRFYDPVAGEIRVDGKPVSGVTLESLRGQIGIVTQETILFNDTIASNIAYGKSGVSQEDIEKAARTANAHDFILKLPEKYNTRVGDRGFKLSGGEKQRIAIARAVFKNPPILILDEATSALDSENELLVQNAIQNLMTGRTVLVIAHRLSTIKHADRIVVIENGRVTEQGRHDDLLKSNGLYKKIYEMQFAG